MYGAAAGGSPSRAAAAAAVRAGLRVEVAVFARGGGAYAFAATAGPRLPGRGASWVALRRSSSLPGLYGRALSASCSDDQSKGSTAVPLITMRIDGVVSASL